MSVRVHRLSYTLFETNDGEESTRPGMPHRVLGPTVVYWFGLDSHVYAMAIAANVLFGFFPFMLLMLSLATFAFPSSNVEQVILLGLRAFLPEDPGLVEFVIRNLRAAVENRGSVQVVSVFLLLLSANGVFMPLEVAQNRLWSFPAHRNYGLNQLISLGITTVLMTAALLAALFAAAIGPLLYELATPTLPTPDIATLWALKFAEAIVLTVVLFLIYWVLPNGPVPRKRALATAFAVALLVEVGQIAYAWIWPWLDLRGEYGPFFISVTLMLWGFFAAMVVLAGAEVCARHAVRSKT